MARTTKGLSIFSGALGFLQSKPTKVKKRSARASSAKIISKQNKQSSGGRKQRFQAAEIKFEECACQAVKSMKGRRFLVRDVPRIPVPDCDKTNCKCTYVRYRDRRLWTEDRRAFYSIKSSHFIQSDAEERRKEQDRRADAGSQPESLDEFEAWFK